MSTNALQDERASVHAQFVDFFLASLRPSDLRNPFRGESLHDSWLRIVRRQVLIQQMAMGGLTLPLLIWSHHIFAFLGQLFAIAVLALLVMYIFPRVGRQAALFLTRGRMRRYEQMHKTMRDGVAQDLSEPILGLEHGSVQQLKSLHWAFARPSVAIHERRANIEEVLLGDEFPRRTGLFRAIYLWVCLLSDEDFIERWSYLWEEGPKRDRFRPTGGGFHPLPSSR